MTKLFACPTGKRCHHSKLDAIRAGRKLSRNLQGGPPVDHYRCRECCFWHVGHRPKLARVTLPKLRRKPAMAS